MKPSGIVTLTTDFGTSDYYQAVMKGVILSSNPECKIVDITHGISKHAVSEASYVLSSSYKYFPKGTIHLAVVDPGVGSKRLPIMIKTDDYYYVGPDNGIFSFLKDQKNIKVYAIKQPEKVSNTFHGRDIFAPAASKLSKGIKPEELGVEVKDFIKLKIKNPLYSTKRIDGEIIHADSFGNLITNLDAKKIKELIGKNSFKANLADHTITKLLSTYDSSGNDLFLIEGSTEKIEISLKNNSAKDLTKANIGDSVEIIIGNL
ncbi:MAG: SAM-dependent chlorinase/fluorinase [Desulfobacterales bacterium]|nr:SAM-dependent chlorinase/fluorinase [Desulfobacterales bacterium]MCP4160597.1 SAM-dependent chlorinase/fluorinase [Deltaproteobacteria bacterium]